MWHTARARRIANKRAIVTGASGGIGRAIAIALADRGVRVALAARGRPGLDQVAAEVRRRGGEALVVPTDVTQPTQVDRLVSTVVDAWGGVDIVVANAGTLVRGDVRHMGLDDLHNSMSTNFFGAAHLVLATLPQLLAQASGHIVLMSSADAVVFLPLEAAYVAAKSALYGFADVLRQELYRTGIDVTIVLPGRVDTSMISGLSFHPIVGVLSPERVARATVRAILARRAVVVMPPQVALFRHLKAFAPRVSDWVARIFRFEGSESSGGHDLPKP